MAVVVERGAYRPSPWRQFLRSSLALAVPRRRYLVRGPADGHVCLTFDDGPHPDFTPGLLDALKEYGVPATFFVIGEQAERHPDLVRRMAGEGHVVGHHSYAHTAPAKTSARQLLEEVRRTRSLLAGLLGQAPNLFRPPFGMLTWAKLWRLWRRGQTIVLWNVDPKDYACQSADQVGQWFQRQALHGGDVILMHENRAHTAAAVAHVVKAVRGQGLRFSTIDRWTR